MGFGPASDRRTAVTTRLATTARPTRARRIFFIPLRPGWRVHGRPSRPGRAAASLFKNGASGAAFIGGMPVADGGAASGPRGGNGPVRSGHRRETPDGALGRIVHVSAGLLQRFACA